MIYLMRDPLDVTKVHEGGIENTAAFLTETISLPQLEILSSLMDERKCESVEIN